jgi:hypothetical protein
MGWRVLLSLVYSEFTQCPDCLGLVHFSRLVFGREFACPHCAAEIRISSRYKRILDLASFILGLLIPFLVGVRSWVIFLCWIHLWDGSVCFG